MSAAYDRLCEVRDELSALWSDLPEGSAEWRDDVAELDRISEALRAGDEHQAGFRIERWRSAWLEHISKSKEKAR